MFFRFLLLFFFLSYSNSFAQKNNYTAFNISDSLKQNANSVIRLKDVFISIPKQNEMVIKTKEITTILNELGMRDLDLSSHYDKNTQLSKISAIILDQFGNEVKTYKRKDFRDQSVADGISIFSDNRMLYLDYTPISYPFTVIFETEITTSNTAFIQPFIPITDFLVSTESYSYTIQFDSSLTLLHKEINFNSDYKIQKEQKENLFHYMIENYTAKKREDLFPRFSNVFPMVVFALENFQLEKVNGSAKNWHEFGKWYYQTLLADTEEIPELTRQKLKESIGNEKDPIEIAKKVYQFVQEKTRYVSVQVGIGGWKPMLAKDVDKLGYGDCKALTNYTRSLLKSLGVESFYTVVYAGEEPRDLIEDFASIQGNHVILSIPQGDNYIWLECTSQSSPFSYQGDFTDDRKVLIVKPEGGIIVNTKEFKESESLKITNGEYTIDDTGSINGTVKMTSYGIQYEAQLEKEMLNNDDRMIRYKEEFSNINNLSIKKMSIKNDKDKIAFSEDLELSAQRYAEIMGNDLMFAPNAFDQNNFVPKKYKQRNYPFEVARGYTDETEIIVHIPQGYYVKAKPNNVLIENEFGSYKIDFVETDKTSIKCKRRLQIKKGFYEKFKYENYRKFRETVAKSDNSKLIISKTL